MDPTERVTRRVERLWLSGRLVAILVAGMGMLFIVAGSAMTWDAIEFTRRTRRTEGRVVGVESVSEPGDQRRAGKLQYYPYVEFTDERGDRHEFLGDVSRGSGSGVLRQSGWQTGQRVTVRYDPANPDHARLAGGWALMPLLLAAFGVLAVVMAVVIFRSSKEEPPVIAATETTLEARREVARQADNRRRYFHDNPPGS